MAQTITSKTPLFNERDMQRALARIAHEIIEGNAHEQPLALVGIRRRGVPIAKRLGKLIETFNGSPVPVGELDITLYRDDLSQISVQPTVNATDIPFPVEGIHIVLVDDVLYTGRTARAAMDAVIHLGRPECIKLMTLIDRGHRELPIRADYIGKNIPTAKTERIHVCVKEIDGEDAVYIVR